MTVSGKAWPGYAIRFCPVCHQETGTHRKPVEDRRSEVVEYHQHRDTARRKCVMSDQYAAIGAVAFTGRGR